MIHLIKRIVAWLIFFPLGFLYLVSLGTYVLIGYGMLWAMEILNIPKDFYEEVHVDR